MYKWNKTWQFIQLSENPLRIQSQKQLRKIYGWIKPHSSEELYGRCQAYLHPAGFTSATQLTLGSFSCSCTFDFFLCHILPHVFFVLCVLLQSWPYIKSRASRHSAQTCWQMTSEAAGDGQPVMHFLRWVGYCLSVAPQLKAPGAEWF